MMKKTGLTFALVCIAGFVVTLAATAQVGPPIADAIWGDGELYRTVPTPTHLPDKGPKDGLFAFTNLAGQHSVSEAKPGDRDYNGGRWAVYMLAFTEKGLEIHDADNDGVADFELTSWEQVVEHIEYEHLVVVGTGSLVCPMIP